MIKRLKRRFIIVNFSILTCVLLAVIISIFAIMYNSEVKLSYELIESIMSKNRLFMSDPAPESLNEGSIIKDALDVSQMRNDYIRNDDRRPNNEGWDPEFPRGWDMPPENMEPRQIPTLPSPAVDEAEKDDADEIEQPAEIENNNNDDTDDDEAAPVITKSPETNKKNDLNNEQLPPANENNDNNIPKYEEEPQEVTTAPKKTEIKSEKTSVAPNENAFSETQSILDNRFRHDVEMPKKTEPDPFEGKVKRSYIYIEFKDVEQLEKIIYEYGASEDDEAVKKAAKTIFNDGKERGTINIGEEKYRFILHYEPRHTRYSIVLLDRTLEINTISRLLFTFLIITGAGLVFIFFISVLLANWTIKPVEKAWTQQKEFIANASHELKTPLTVISANTDVILSSPDDTVKNQKKWLNYIKNETTRMSKLVNSLLYIAKYDSNKINMIYSNIDLSNLISSIALQYEPLAFENNKHLITDIDEGLNISADEDKIKQVINILLDNAMKYSSEDGTIKISLKQPKPSSVCITISNTSEDIPKGQMDKIFDRFYRVDDSRNRKTGGSGLGLNIAKTIVENHKGSIVAVNKDHITSFIVTLSV